MARQWVWHGDEASQVAGTGGAGILVALLTAGDLDKGQTVARILGNIAVGKAVSSTGGPKFGMGLILLNDGVTIAPNPYTDADAPWLFHQTGFIPAFDAAGDFGITRFAVDVHGMRKVQGDQRLFIVIGQDSAVSMSYYWGLRIGVKLA